MFQFINRLFNKDNGAIGGATRSPHWPATRAAHLVGNPTCAACGGTKKCEVHHVAPFHNNPEKELDPNNLITLCEANKFMNCHLALGHLGNFKSWNVNVRQDSANYLQEFTNRPK